MEAYTGNWVLQGISWPIRKAINLTTPHLEITIHSDPTSGATSSTTIYTLGGGLAGATEIRVFDWSEQPHKDYIFGVCRVRSRVVYALDSRLGSSVQEGIVERVSGGYPDFEMQTKIKDGIDRDKVWMFLRGEDAGGETRSVCAVSVGLGEKDGEEGSSSGVRSASRATWVQTFLSSLTEGWTLEQIWGFEEIDGVLHQVRRAVAANAKGQYALARQVFKRD
ncbi:hypothetical protein BJY04DRAFT_219051 [Aspergillus karnatakaensis]|uniref:uncharacterized protein n=1 Tax=Aspergillus karnatakaensis TaxID=1810916 RepID=UPI003CCDC85E